MSRETEKKVDKKKPAHGENRGKAFRSSCVRETCAPGLCHSFRHVFPFISCSCLSPRKTTAGLRGFGSVTVPLCVFASADTISPSQKTPTKNCWCFSQEPRWLCGAGCGLIWAKDLTRPRGGGETGASGRGKAGEAL